MVRFSATQKELVGVYVSPTCVVVCSFCSLDVPLHPLHSIQCTADRTERYECDDEKVFIILNLVDFFRGPTLFRCVEWTFSAGQHIFNENNSLSEYSNVLALTFKRKEKKSEEVGKWLGDEDK